MRTIDYASELNPDQLAAVTHGEGPQLVVAGAGSGKTRVITYRVAWLVEQGVAPDRIVAVTFTNKAAGEMRERVQGLLGLDPLPTFVGTFHRYALVLLRRWGERVGVPRDFAIFDADDQLRLVKQALAEEGLSEGAFPPRSVRAAISAAKNRLADAAAFETRAGSFFARSIVPVFHRYERALQRSGGLDFDDMLVRAVRLLAADPELKARLRRRTEHLLVDEFQDTNHAQLRLVVELAGGGGNLTAVGDEDQGIYRWRGAELENILRFEQTFPGATVRKLERNYRSTANILAAADAVVSHNTLRRDKRLWTRAEAGLPLTLYRARDETDEARWIVDTLERQVAEIPLADATVLVRTNAQTRALEEELLARRIPYTLVGGTRFYERAEIKDLVAYLRLLRNPYDTMSLERVLNRPPRGIGEATRRGLLETAAGAGVPAWELLAYGGLGGFPTRAAAALNAFRDLVVRLREASTELALPALVERLLEETGYREQFDQEDAEGQSRLENIEEFRSAAQGFIDRRASRGGRFGEIDGADPLTAFLDHASLTNELDDWQQERGLSVMTLHAAKGLEFGCVVIAGMEDGLLPHFNADEAQEDLEEERRLLYVGMTRAKARLALTCCRRRRIAGRFQDRQDSPFLHEIPDSLLEVERSRELFVSARTSGVIDFFGRRAGRGSGDAAAAGERVYEPADEAAGAAGQRGVRVRHPTLGPGVVLAADGDGPDAKVTVYFDRVGRRKLIARYANLERI
ncbi:MAG: ATP-dependent helicase [Thermoanaerobaculia bacterium]